VEDRDAVNIITNNAEIKIRDLMGVMALLFYWQIHFIVVIKKPSQLCFSGESIHSNHPRADSL
jgi:hypothetical protein